MRRRILGLLALLTATAAAGESPPATNPATKPAGKLPFVAVDVKARQVRVECEPCFDNMDVGLEFFCVLVGTNEYESVLRSPAKASDMHLALLMIGLEPGAPARYDEPTKKWLPPHGPPLNISCEFEKDHKKVSVPAYRLMRNIKTHKEMPPFTFIFCGSKEVDGRYAADAVGYHVAVLNNELTVIDIPALASRDLESREWERNAELLPPRGTHVQMLIEPAAKEVIPDFPAPPKGEQPGGELTGSAKPEVAVAPAGPKEPSPDLGITVVALDAFGRVQVDGIYVRMEAVTAALTGRRVTPKVLVRVGPDAREADVRQLVDAVRAAKVPVVDDAGKPTTLPATTSGPQ